MYSLTKNVPVECKSFLKNNEAEQIWYYIEAVCAMEIYVQVGCGNLKFANEFEFETVFYFEVNMICRYWWLCFDGSSC